MPIEIVYNPPCIKCGKEHENIAIPFCDECLNRIKAPIVQDEIVMSEKTAKFCASNPEDLGKVIRLHKK